MVDRLLKILMGHLTIHSADFVGTNNFAYLVTGYQDQTDIALVTLDLTPITDTESFASNATGTRVVDNFVLGNRDSVADVLDFQDLLLDGVTNTTLSNYVLVVDVGDGNDVTLLVDKNLDGSNDLTIIL